MPDHSQQGTPALREELPDAAPRAFRIFTGTTESDPHRIAFYDVTLSTTGVQLARAEVPRGQEEPGEISWADLHALLGHTDALLDDREELRRSNARTAAELRRLRTERGRLVERIRRARLEVDRLDEQLRRTGRTPELIRPRLTLTQPAPGATSEAR